MDDTQSNRPDNLGDISDSGLILLKAKLELAAIRHETVPAHIRPRSLAPENSYDPQSCDGPPSATQQRMISPGTLNSSQPHSDRLLAF